jgi:hypothetical protein
MGSTYRSKPAQFKLYFTVEEKRDLLKLASERKERPSDVLRRLLRREITGGEALPSEETSDPQAAPSGGSTALDRWREARRLRRERAARGT